MDATWCTELTSPFTGIYSAMCVQIVHVVGIAILCTTSYAGMCQTIICRDVNVLSINVHHVHTQELSGLYQLVWSDTGMMVRLYHIFLATSWYRSVILFDTDWALYHIWCQIWYSFDCPKCMTYLTSDLTTHLIQFQLLDVYMYKCAQWYMYMYMEFLFLSPHPVTVHF